MDSNFNFEVRADDVASDVLQQINDKVKALQPELVKTREGLALGGSESEEGLETLGSRLKNMSVFAKQNVQFIGDMVPPLKMVSGFTGDLAGKVIRFGAMGAAAYGVVKGVSAVGGAMADAASDAYSLDVAAKNAGMSVRDMSHFSGAMHLLGVDETSARGSAESWYKIFNDALQGRNGNVRAVMDQINAPIVRNADGTADALKTMESLANIFPRLSPQNQKTVADSLGLDANGLQLLREGARLKALLAESDRIGLTVDPQTNAQLVQLNGQLNELWARIDGLTKKAEQKTAGFLLSKSKDDVGSSLAEAKKYDGKQFYHGDRDKDIRWRALRDKEFLSTLTTGEHLDFTLNRPDKEVTRKLNARYGAEWSAGQLQADLLAVKASPATAPQGKEGHLPAGSVIDPSKPSVRNNNPWNLNYAGQRGASPAGRFAAFPTPEAGLLAADRQLQLYASGKSQAAHGKPLTTLKDIISVASPKNENNTRQMIIDASKEMQVSPDQQLHLTDPRERARVLHAVFEREGNNPWSTDQMSNLITSQNNSMVNSPLVTPAPNQDAAGQEVNSAVKALQEKGFKVEITLVNDQTGERQTYNANTGGKVATAMTFP